MALLDWPRAPLQDELRRLLPRLRVAVVERTDSTNTQLVERARSGDATPRLLVAEAQTAGRGRQGRRWVSHPGASLTFSIALPLTPRDWSGLSAAAGVALAAAIEPVPARLQLKWPNDLWLYDGADSWRKLGGVLVETVHAGTARVAVVGVGLNVTALPHDDAPAGGIAWAGELRPQIDAPALLSLVAPPLLQALLQFEVGGFAPFAGAYAARDLLRGRSVTTTLPGLGEGVAEGLDDDGALLVRHACRVQRLTSGEVSVRPLPASRAA